MLEKAFKDKHYETLDQVREHYEIEKELANNLRHSTKQKRAALYKTVYDELYQRLPNNSIVNRKSSPSLAKWVAGQRLQLLNRFLKSNTTFLEIGPGDCSLCFEAARQVRKVYAVDVTNRLNRK
jgi:hypothetical protein